MAKRVCYVHVGTGKTGTSAIQYALTKAQDHLLSRGFHYPDISKDFKRVLNREPTSGNAFAVAEILREKGSKHATRLLSRFSNRPENLVLSCEGLSNFRLEKLKELVRDINLLGYDTKCLVFFRPQVEMLVSQYLQMVKTNKISGSTLSDYVQSTLNIGKFKKGWNWYARAQKLDKAFGDSNVTVKWYPAVTRRESAGVVHTVFDWMGAALPSNYSAAYNTIINPTPGRESLLVLERLSLQGLASKRFSDRFLIEAHNREILGGIVMLESSLFKRVESVTRISNARLLEHYCPELSVKNELRSSADCHQMDAIDESQIDELTKIASDILWSQRPLTMVVNRIKHMTSKLLKSFQKDLSDIE